MKAMCKTKKETGLVNFIIMEEAFTRDNGSITKCVGMECFFILMEPLLTKVFGVMMSLMAKEL